MAKIKVCDFCLEEFKGFFGGPETLPDEHMICKNCKKIIESYDLPVKYDLFQVLVTAHASQREMIMGDYLEHHSADDTLAKFYPMPSMLLHKGEHCANCIDASIRVTKAMIPMDKQSVAIGEITRQDISDLPDCPTESGSEVVVGKLYETEAALYFVSEHFINCHRLTSVIHENPNPEIIQVMSKTKTFTYSVQHSDLFFLRERMFQITLAYKSNKNHNLVYISSENTMTITPGVYSVPKNLNSGTYWVEPLKDEGLSIRDAAGRVRAVRSGRVHLDAGTTVEVAGEYKLRITKGDDSEESN